MVYLNRLCSFDELGFLHFLAFRSIHVANERSIDTEKMKNFQRPFHVMLYNFVFNSSREVVIRINTLVRRFKEQMLTTILSK